MELLKIKYLNTNKPQYITLNMDMLVSYYEDTYYMNSKCIYAQFSGVEKPFKLDMKEFYLWVNRDKRNKKINDILNG